MKKSKPIGRVAQFWGELLHIFWMTFLLMVSALLHLALIMVGAWVSYEIPDIDRDTRTCIFLGWMAAQFLGAHLLYKRLSSSST